MRRKIKHRGHPTGREFIKIFEILSLCTTQGCMLIMLKNYLVSKSWCIGLPWWLSGKESACQCRRHGFDPWSGKVPHAAEQPSWGPQLLRLCLRAWELQLLKPARPRARAPQQERLLPREAWAPQLESSPCSPTPEKSPRCNKDPVQPRGNKMIFKHIFLC